MIEPGHFHNQCILCGSPSLKNIFGDDHFITKCNQCTFVFSRKIASEKEILDYYTAYPVQNRISDLTLQRYNEILDLYEPYRETGKLLEFGCGEGYFLAEAKRRGWNVTGIEITDTLIQKCREKNIPAFKNINQIPTNDIGQFDIVVSIEVIEHLSPPKYYSEMFNTLLRIGGGLYMTTPNFNCLSRRILGARWNNIIYPEHCCYYTAKTMNSLLTENHFKKVFLLTTGISPSRIKYALLNWKKDVGQEETLYDYNEKDRMIREKIENKYLLSKFKKWANGLLNTMRFGESLKIFYLKK